MAANRKLQGEIDRTLKKVQEGVEIFDEIWEKVYGAQNQNQKEKFESELKSQIKKLQRYRDDIKTWITNSDIKDKRPLTDARKLIETEMERFKVCEKEFKTKAFSKEGLSQACAPKEDPKEKERNRVRKWIASALETITGQVDVYEAELEQINSAKKKKKDSGAQKWEDLIERCRYHEERLELVLRLIDNESLSPEDVDSIKDQLDYLLEQMVDGNSEEVDGIDDDSIYEELGLDELGGAEEAAKAEEAMAAALPAQDAKADPKVPDVKDLKKSKKDLEKEEKEAKEKEKEKKREKEKITTTELPSINAAAKLAPPPKPGKEPAKPVAAVPVVKSAPTPVLPAAPSVRGKAAAQVPLTAQPPAARGGRGQAEQAGLMARAGLPPAPPVTSTASAPMRMSKDLEPSGALGIAPALGVAKQPPAGLPPPSMSRGSSLTHETASSGSPAQLPPTGLPPPVPRAAMGALPSGLGALDSSSMLPSCGHAEDGGLPVSLAGAVGLSASSEELGSARPPDEHETGAVRSLVPGGGHSSASRLSIPDLSDEALMLGDEPELFDELAALVADATSSSRKDDPMLTLQMLNLSLQNMPEPSDSERPKTYTPRNPYPTPNSFPQTPAAVFDSPAVFDKFDTDTLFFIFYYQQGTYQQYLAARELKKQSWRYHKKYLTWFQRHEEPKVTAEEFEQGTYVYFDYETGWCQRIKSEFTFEYGYLEDELQV
ncbi:hypothetical protein AB1Y20_000584 [Prymnesium parvum]|uniref:CCR4-NOT transcription complex subunit 3 n=1 Tax=Prymnesium parvum TaxID=97485 RepID=A0AB34K8F4_PRYPA